MAYIFAKKLCTALWISNKKTNEVFLGDSIHFILRHPGIIPGLQGPGIGWEMEKGYGDEVLPVSRIDKDTNTGVNAAAPSFCGLFCNAISDRSLHPPVHPQVPENLN